MKVKYAFLADAAQESGGKLSALGIGIDRVNPPQLPFLVPLTIVAVLEYSATEVGTKRLTVRLIDADGNDVREEIPTIEMTLQKPASGSRGLMNIIVNYQTQFKAAGDYTFHLTLDGTDIAVLPIAISEPAGQPDK